MKISACCRYSWLKRCRSLPRRDFLLSLSDLDVCKKLPMGFDPAVLGHDGAPLCDFGEASNSTTEWPRPPGSFSSQSFRRVEFGSSPPTRVESSNFSRGSHGRWGLRQIRIQIPENALAINLDALGKIPSMMGFWAVSLFQEHLQDIRQGFQPQRVEEMVNIN